MAAEATAEKRTLSRVMKPRRTVPSKDMDWKTERSKVPELRPMGNPSKKTSVDLLAKEEEYIRLNAELEAKTADLVRQAEQVMREQNDVLSKPLSSFLMTATEDENEDSRPQQHAVQSAGTKVVRNKRLTSTPVSNDTHSGYERKAQRVSNKTATLNSVGADDGDIRLTADIDDSIQSMEEKLNDVEGDTIASDAQIRVLKARLHIMHEEFNQLSHECHRKDEENFKLGTKIKELEGDRARLQKNSNIQQTQIEKHRALAEDSSRRCDALQMQVAALQKEIEALNKSQKQAAGSQSTVEVRLNRALEDIERYKTQLSNMKLKNKDQEHLESLNKENLLAENKMLKKQKAELILGFKKQLKLIDILKRQKMHFETAKMLSFTEEEFMKALDWGSHKARDEFI